MREPVKEKERERERERARDRERQREGGIRGRDEEKDGHRSFSHWKI